MSKHKPTTRVESPPQPAFVVPLGANLIEKAVSASSHDGLMDGMLPSGTIVARADNGSVAPWSLTVTTADGSQTNEVPVESARYYRVGDTVSVGAHVARVMKCDYESHTLTIDAAISWSGVTHVTHVDRDQTPYAILAETFDLSSGNLAVLMWMGRLPDGVIGNIDRAFDLNSQFGLRYARPQPME